MNGFDETWPTVERYRVVRESLGDEAEQLAFPSAQARNQIRLIHHPSE